LFITSSEVRPKANKRMVEMRGITPLSRSRSKAVLQVYSV